MMLPLIRAGAIAPFLIWMQRNRIDLEARLQAVGLPGGLIAEPDRPIPLQAGIRFVAAAAASEGPDLGCRVVGDESIAELGPLGLIVLGAGSPREALQRAVRAYSYHGSHEHFALSPTAAGAVVRHSFRVPVDDAALHVCQQYVAAMVGAVAGGTDFRGVRLTRIALTPHPVHGLAHLRAHFRGELVAAPGRAAELSLPGAALDRPYLGPRRLRQLPAEAGWAVMRGDGTLAGSIRAILPDLLASRGASVATLAELAFTSPRTLQRRLAAEGVSVSGLVAETRQALALADLGGARRVGDIALTLGYGSTSSFSRAVRRWTDRSPRRIRAG